MKSNLSTMILMVNIKNQNTLLIILQCVTIISNNKVLYTTNTVRLRESYFKINMLRNAEKLHSSLSGNVAQKAIKFISS